MKENQYCYIIQPPGSCAVMEVFQPGHEITMISRIEYFMGAPLEPESKSFAARIIEGDLTVFPLNTALRAIQLKSARCTLWIYLALNR